MREKRYSQISWMSETRKTTVRLLDVLRAESSLGNTSRYDGKRKVNETRATMKRRDVRWPGSPAPGTKINCNQHRCINQIVRRVGSERRIETVGRAAERRASLRMICRWHALPNRFHRGVCSSYHSRSPTT